MSVQNIALHIVDIDVLTDVPRHPYHVTLVTDATAAFGPEEMDAAHHVNGPTYAHAILDTKELIAALGHSV